ncbi:MAG: ATP-binding cassette domain-containing protein [Betaproteobacteria bacterium]|nr:ATP-binding cassette domain-containing protein [Betaproteobacteria bacterium]
MKLLEGTDIGRDFGGLKALDAVTFHVDRGEILGLIGPNGAGKTTLLNCISGILPVSGGRLRFKGREINSLGPHLRARLGIARTFQIVKPFQGLTVRQNVAVGALFGASRSSNTKEALKSADFVLEHVGLGPYANASAATLTVTQRKRLELARALATGAELVLLDEVMAGLNPVEIESLMELIRELNARGTTFLFIEHVMKAIMAMSHRIMVLHHGKNIAEGSPADISRNPDVISAYLGERYVKAKEATPGTEMPASSAAEATETPLLQVKGLASGYGDVQVLSEVDLEVRRRELVAVVGPNSAGKTTLLRTISGLLTQRQGSVSFDGHDATKLSPNARVRLGVSQVPEGRLLFAGMSVRENLIMGAFTVKDPAQVKATYERVLDYFPELRERQNQLAGTLSGGEQQMLAIGRALLSRPKVLLLDEMSMGLAPMIVDRLMQIMVRISREEGVAVLLVEQDVQVALEITERGYVIENGRVVLHGASAELLRDDGVKRAYLGV